MRKVNLSMNENEKYQAIKNLVKNGGNKKRVAVKLGTSIRQVNRLIIKYNETGKSAFYHGNHDVVPHNKRDQSISDTIIQLYKDKYYDFNFSHFRDKLEEDENISVSYSFLYKLLSNNDILSPRATKRTKKARNKDDLVSPYFWLVSFSFEFYGRIFFV